MGIDASDAGTFKIGGDLEVNRLGFGAMRIVGDGIWGPPEDRVRALAILGRLTDFGVNFIDTADSYGPYISEELIAEALHPYDGIVVATKAGLVRHGPGIWKPLGRPEYLRHCCLMSMRRLKVDQIDLFQLHRIDPKVPRDEQFAELRSLQEDGLVRHIGLSGVSVEEIEAARRFLDVATVQNRYNVAERHDEDVLKYCEREGIGFIPWYPLRAGGLVNEEGALSEVAVDHGATTSQIALSWLLTQSPVMLPIPGTGSLKHLEENVEAASIRLARVEYEYLNLAV